MTGHKKYIQFSGNMVQSPLSNFSFFLDKQANVMGMSCIKSKIDESCECKV